MVTDIKGNKILFFSPAFFNYEDIIAVKMRELGAEVDMYNVRSVTKAFDRALIKISPLLFKKKTLQYYENILATAKGKDYDYILIIKCDMTPESILERFKAEFPSAKICLYLWDSVENIPGITTKFKYFDTLHSFDLEDCRRYKELKFRPLFFADQFREKEHKGKYDFKYDISFCGTVHSDRYAVIKQVQKIAEEKGLKCYWFLYLQSKFIYRFYKLTKREFKDATSKLFSFEKMPANEVAKVADESRIILDIQHPKQTGLTMRTIEMVGMKKKLVTTNQSIMNYDFYSVDNIAIVNREKVDIPSEFINGTYIPIPETVYERYTLQSWIFDVLS